MGANRGLEPGLNPISNQDKCGRDSVQRSFVTNKHDARPTQCRSPWQPPGLQRRACALGSPTLPCSSVAMKSSHMEVHLTPMPLFYVEVILGVPPPTWRNRSRWGTNSGASKVSTHQITSAICGRENRVQSGSPPSHSDDTMVTDSWLSNKQSKE